MCDVSVSVAAPGNLRLSLGPRSSAASGCWLPGSGSVGAGGNDDAASAPAGGVADGAAAGLAAGSATPRSGRGPDRTARRRGSPHPDIRRRRGIASARRPANHMLRAVGLRPTRGQLDTGDRVVTAADSDALAAAARDPRVTAIVAGVAAASGPSPVLMLLNCSRIGPRRPRIYNFEPPMSPGAAPSAGTPSCRVATTRSGSATKHWSGLGLHVGRRGQRRYARRAAAMATWSSPKPRSTAIRNAWRAATSPPATRSAWNRGKPVDALVLPAEQHHRHGRHHGSRVALRTP